MSKPSDKHLCLLVCILLILSTLVVFRQVRNYDFVNYDDQEYVSENEHVQAGLTTESIKWAFTTTYFSNWHPLTWLSHMLDCQLFGTNAGRHHLSSLVLHIANTLLLFVIFKKMTGALWPSAFVAAAFALHPLHVESVAWISERKDVLSTFFWILTMGAYHLYVKRPGIGWYLLILLLFAMGLMAKPMLVTLPFVLLLLDYWPLNRMKFANDTGKTKSISRLIIEKLPFFALSVISSVVTFIVQRSGGAVSAIETFGIKVRIFNALTSYIGYIQKIFWPSGLAALYPHPGDNVSMSKAAICAVVLVLISICFLLFGRRRKYLAVGWLWYLGTLVPVIGLVQVGAQAMADRYTYVPLTGLFIIAAWAAREISIRRPRSKTMIATAALAVLAAVIVCTTVQLKYWQNSTTLFERTLAVTKENYLMQNNYGNILKDSGRLDEAIEHFNEALRLRPNNPEVHNNLGNALADKSQIEQAIGHYQKAIELTKDRRMGGNLQAGFGQAHYNFANALKKQGRFEEAIKHYKHTIRVTPDDVYAYNNLGLCLTELNRLDEAVEYYRKAIEIKPDFALAHGWLGLAFAQLGKTDEAAREIQLVLKQRPDDSEMHCNLGIILERQGKTEEAIAHYRRALEIDANYTKAKNLLDTVLAEKQSR